MRGDIAAALAGRPVAAGRCRRRQHRPSRSRAPPCCPARSTIPAVGDRSHRDDRDGKGGRAFGYVAARPGRARRVRHRRADRAVGARRRRRQRASRCPDVTGLTVAEARTDLQAEGLTARRADPEGTATPSPRAASSTRARSRHRSVDEGGAGLGHRLAGPDEADRAVAGRALARRGPPGAERGRPRARATPTRSPRTRRATRWCGSTPRRARRSRPSSTVNLRYASGNNEVPDVVGKDEADGAQPDRAGRLHASRSPPGGVGRRRAGHGDPADTRARRRPCGSARR